MKVSFQIKTSFPVKPEMIYQAWLNSEAHTDMTGGEAQCSPEEGEAFSAWDGYITGRNLKLVKNKEIRQSWRTSEFTENDEDSTIIIRLEPVSEGCELTLIHENIPQGKPDYKQGWIEYYFNPMKAYFD